MMKDRLLLIQALAAAPIDANGAVRVEGHVSYAYFRRNRLIKVVLVETQICQAIQISKLGGDRSSHLI